MFRRTERTFVMAPVVPLPTGNVAVVPNLDVKRDVPAQRQPDGDADTIDDVDAAATGWSIRNGGGDVVRGGLPDRATASRMLGALAVHGAALPLIVYRPDGEPAGERLG